MKFWQVIGDRRYRRDVTAASGPWTAVLTWHGEQGDRVTADEGAWLLQLERGDHNGLAASVVERTIRFRPADLDRSTPTPPYLDGDRETMEVQHALRTAERYVESHLGARFERFDLEGT